MSLLLDALQRASREKAGVSAASVGLPVAVAPEGSPDPSAPPVEVDSAVANGAAPVSGGIAKEPLSLSLTPTDWPALKNIDPPLEQRSQPTPEVDELNSEASLTPNTVTKPVGSIDFPVNGGLTPPNKEAPEEQPVPLALEPQKPVADRPSSAVSSVPGLELVSATATSPQPPAPTSSTEAPKPPVADQQRAAKAAQNIRRAHAQKKRSGLRGVWLHNRRAMLLGGVALVLAVGGGSLILWGGTDILVALGLVSRSTVATGVAVGVPVAPVTNPIQAQPPVSAPGEAPVAAASPPVVPATDPNRNPEPTQLAVQASSPLAAVPLRAKKPGGKIASREIDLQEILPPPPVVSVTSLPAVGKPVAYDAKTAAGANNKAEIAVRTRQPALVERAYAALTASQWEEARGLYEAALGSNAQDRDALLGLAYLAARSGRMQEASSFYQEVLRFDPSNHSALAGLMSLEAYSSAEPSANRARELAQRQPESANALAAAAAAMVREGQLAEAEQLYGRAWALEPLVGAYAFNHAVALDRLGQYARALPQYEAALRLAERPGSGVPVETVRQRVAVLRQALEGAAGK